MPDSMRKKQGESIKLPQDLQDALRREIAIYLARGEKPPTRGELLLSAWRSYKATTATLGHDSAATSTLPPIGGDAIVHDSTLALATTGPIAQLSHLEKTAIERLLRIIRSPLPGLPDAILSNLIQFEAFHELYERTGATDPASRPEADEQAAIDANSRRIAEIEQSARESNNAVARNQEAAKRIGEAGDQTDRELEELRRAAAGEHPAKAPHAVPHRKRSGT